MKRDLYIQECKAEFRVNARETDPVKIQMHIDMASMELERIRAYTDLPSTGDMSLDLK